MERATDGKHLLAFFGRYVPLSQQRSGMGFGYFRKIYPQDGHILRWVRSKQLCRKHSLFIELNRYVFGGRDNMLIGNYEPGGVSNKSCSVASAYLSPYSNDAISVFLEDRRH